MLLMSTPPTQPSSFTNVRLGLLLLTLAPTSVLAEAPGKSYSKGLGLLLIGLPLGFCAYMLLLAALLFKSKLADRWAYVGWGLAGLPIWLGLLLVPAEIGFLDPVFNIVEPVWALGMPMAMVCAALLIAIRKKR
jgi:hypothetical protein